MSRIRVVKRKVVKVASNMVRRARVENPFRSRWTRMCNYVGIRSKVGRWSRCRTLMRGYWDFFDIRALSGSVALNTTKLACAKVGMYGGNRD